MTLPRTPALATDCIIFDPIGRVLLIRRKHSPCAGNHALPGGFVKVGETVEEACRREVGEETSIELGAYPRRRLLRRKPRPPRSHSQCSLCDPAPQRCLAKGRFGCDERRVVRHARSHARLRPRTHSNRRQR